MAWKVQSAEPIGSLAVKPFFQRDTAAGVLVGATLAAAVLVEWG
jgi:hypothetical protein